MPHDSHERAKLLPLPCSDAQKGGADIATPDHVRFHRCTHTSAAVKFRLTLFLQPNHGFGESFNGLGRRRPALFSVPSGRISALNTALEPARQLAETLDQGLGAVGFRHPGLDVLQPGQIGLAGLLGQGLLSVLHLPK